jgi:uncharacterized protein (DUF433 family)
MITLEYPHVIRAEDGTPCLERHPRIRIAQLAADHIGYGWSAEEIVRQYPHLNLAEVHAALGFYYDHREEIDAELDHEVQTIDAASADSPSKLRVRLRAARHASPA